jgi:hypothetical protein
MSIEDLRNLASAAADIRANSALTQFPKTTIPLQASMIL